jgi:hypothetical protein
MNRRLLPLLVLLLVAPAAQAHFLFVRILPPAEGGRFAEVYFSELAEAGDTRYIEKIAHTQLWLQATPGKFEPLTVRKTPDRLRAYMPGGGSVGVVGSCTYGVLTRKQTAFLLRHYPKAVSGRPEDLNQLEANGKIPLEITATFAADGVRLVALLDGKPMPGAEFNTVDADLAGVKLKANEKGEVFWKPKSSGVQAVYTYNTRKEAGEFGGKRYTEIREFATLAFTWPLVRTDADAAAVALFQEAIASRAQWEKFPGFRAKIEGNLEGRPFTGTVAIDAKGTIDFADDDSSQQAALGGWVEEQLGSIVLHRLPGSPSEKAPVIRFAEGKAEHPLGRLLIFEGGQFASSYRVKDKQIVVVNRRLGKENMTITILDNDRNPEGRFLPRSYTVQYWDAASGRLLRTEAVQTRWQRMGDWDLPTLHQVTVSGDAGLGTRTFTLSKHELLK